MVSHHSEYGYQRLFQDFARGGGGGGRGQMLSIKRVGQVQTTKLAINDVLKILRGEAN